MYLINQKINQNDMIYNGKIMYITVIRLQHAVVQVVILQSLSKK